MGMRGDADEGAEGSVVDSPEFGEESQEGGSEDGADAFDGAQTLCFFP